MDPREIVDSALNAIQRGADPEEVYARIRDLEADRPLVESADQAESLVRAIQFALEAQEDSMVAAAASRASEHGALSNTARMAAQGALFGFADDLLGLFGGDAEASRQRVEDLRTAEPVASAVSDIAGGLLFPAGAVRGGGRVAANVLGRGGRTTRAASRGIFAGTAGGGAIEGAVSGAGEAEGGILERLPEMGVGAGIGAATGGLLAGTGSIFNRVRRGQGPRLADALRKGTGFSGQVNPVFRRAQRRIALVRRGFQRFDDEFPEVKAPEIQREIQELLENADTRASVRSVSRELADGNRLPSFEDLQDIRTNLRKKGLRDEANVLSDAMDEVFGPEFARTNRRYRRALRQQEAIEEGLKAWDWGGERVERRLSELLEEGGPDAVQNFQQGRLAEVIRRLSRRERGTLKPIKDYLEAGESTRDQIESLFMSGDGQIDRTAFQAFSRAIQQENDVDLAWRILKNAGIFVAGAGAGLGLFSGLVN